MKKYFIVFALAFTSLTTLSAQTKTEKIKELMVMTNSGDVGKMMMEQMILQYNKMMPDIPKTFWDEFMKEVSSDDLVNLVVPVYEKHFTEADIDELIRFYKTPVGSKFITSLPVIYQESYQIGVQFGEQLGQKVYQRLVEKGLLEESEE